VELLREATDLWRELDNLPMLADSLTGAAMFASYSGQYKESIEQATTAWELNTRIDNPWGKAYCQYVINGAYTELGDFEAASKSADEGLHWAKIAGFTVPQVMIPCNQALVCGIIGQYDRGLEVTDEAISFGRELLDFWLGAPLAVRLCLLVWKGDLKAAEVQAEDLRHLIDDLESVMFPIARLYVEYALNEYQLAVGEYQAALVSADELIDFQRKHNFVLLWSDALLQRSRAADALGQSEAAGEALKEAVAFAEANHSGRTLWLALHRLSQWTARNGDEAEAAALEGRARQALERVANTLDEDLRKSFLATPEASEAWSE
jgi:tetratricopeptide (TPR) repeat protein